MIEFTDNITFKDVDTNEIYELEDIYDLNDTNNEDKDINILEHSKYLLELCSKIYVISDKIYKSNKKSDKATLKRELVKTSKILNDMKKQLIKQRKTIK